MNFKRIQWIFVIAFAIFDIVYGDGQAAGSTAADLKGNA
jgi:hypothetical protein